ncbi:MAG: toast rack family protein [Anaerolineae bacterium]
MKYAILVPAALLLVGSSLACSVIPDIPNIDINVPTIEVGEMQNTREEIPLSGTESATVEVLFAAGKLEIESGDSDQLFSGRFEYNVEQWEPEVTFENGVLVIRQGGTDKNWGVPTGNTHNEWKLEFSPEIPLEMDIDVGAGDGRLDLTGLQLTELDLQMGAGNFDVRFDEPNEVRMRNFSLNTGAAKLEVRGIGNAGPERFTVNGGVGDITLDFTGRWPNSANADITTGIGSITLRLPDNIGVQVETEGGLTNVESDGFQRQGDTYTNDAFGETEVELRIRVTTGIGNLRLIEVSND